MRKQIAVWLRACADQLDPPKKWDSTTVYVPATWQTTTSADYKITWKRTA